MEEECRERREAELEFVHSAYGPEEAWCEMRSDDLVVVHRRLPLHLSHELDAARSNAVTIQLSLQLPHNYPVEAALQVTGNIDDATSPRCNVSLRKAAYEALPRLLQAGQAIADENLGDESVFMVFSGADEWVREDWPSFLDQSIMTMSKPVATKGDEAEAAGRHDKSPVVLGRRLIYSHHIISKIKRADIKKLASNYELTGYMKIGWPGLLIIEGLEEHCLAFYDEIRPWAWQYLVVRGEQQEKYSSTSTTTSTALQGNQSRQAIEADIVHSKRRFTSFQEVEDMSVVAQHCRNVGLESLFKSSMKVYDNAGEEETDESPTSDPCSYGALVHVDHMNDGKGYRKWLRKTGKETDCKLLLKYSYPNDDYSKRPMIVVGIIADSQADASAFLKRWRTSRVDVDSRGKACLERNMTVLVEGPLEQDTIDWTKSDAEECVTISQDQMIQLVSSIGGEEWKETFAVRSGYSLH